MERKCVIPNCSNKSETQSNITYHVFPKNKVMRQKWIKAIKIENFVPSKNNSVCSKHFEQKCFLKNKTHRLLRKDAVPTIFQDDKKQTRLPTNEVPFSCGNESTEAECSTRSNPSNSERLEKNISPAPLASNGACLPASPTQSSSSISSLEIEDFENADFDNIIFIDKAERKWSTAKKFITKQGKQIAYLEHRNYYLNTKIEKLYASIRILKHKCKKMQFTVIVNNN